MKNIKFALDNWAYAPEKAHDMDAGFDLRTPYDILCPAHSSCMIDTKVHVELPDGYYAKLESKSGLNVKHGIVSCGGVIDAGYTGTIMAKLYNLSDEDYMFRQGDKVVQMVIHSIPSVRLVDVNLDDFVETERGDNGFGSSGR